jgi:hypothetical protein
MPTTFKKVPNAEDILNLLLTSDFDDWYRGDFDEFAIGESTAKHKDDIILDIIRMFKVEVE